MTTKKKKAANVPNLRFPGFEGEWEKKKLGDMIGFKAGYAFPSNRMLAEKSTYQLIKMSNVYQNELCLDRNPSFWFSINSKEKEFLLTKGDTVLTLTGTVGKQDFGYSAQINDDNKYLLNQRLVVLRSIENKTVNNFIAQLVSNEKFLFDFFGIAKGGTGNQANVGIEDLKGITFSFPAIKEQERISNFLWLIDQRIETQNKIIEQLESSIRNLRDKIFKQANRFQDESGNHLPDWRKCKLKDIAERIVHKNLENNSNVLTISAQSGLISQIEFFNKFVSAKDISGYYLLELNDFAYNKSYSNGYPMGAIKRLRLYQKGVVSTLYICFRFNTTVSMDFMEQYFESGMQNSEIEKIAQEGARNHGLLNIAISDFFNIEINLPSLKEQIRIANFLSSVDEKNQMEKQILKQYEKQKRFLLQQMFV